MRTIIMEPVAMVALIRMSADNGNEFCVTAAQHKPYHQLLCNDVADPFSRLHDAWAKGIALYLTGLLPVGFCVPAALNIDFRSALSEPQVPMQATASFAGLVSSQQEPISKIVPTQFNTQPRNLPDKEFYYL